MLARFGFSRIHQSETVAQAIDQLRQKHVDLVILPLEGVADLQLATLEREIRRERYTAVIGTAPKQEPDVMLRAMRAGIQEFLVSPPDPKDLAAAVDRLDATHAVSLGERRRHCCIQLQGWARR